MDPHWSPFFHLERAGITERSLWGAAVVVHGNEILYRNCDPIIFGRSLTKPFQMKVIADVLDKVLSWDEKAVALASHNGSEFHQNAVKKILPESELSLIQLPSLAHPCSGKHAAILKACEIKGWPVDHYLEVTHPFHVAYRELLEKNLSHPLKTFAADGCGLPTWAMSVSDHAHLFASLVVQKNQDWIWEAAQRFPEMIGGPDRVDTLLIKSSPSLFAKEGADGLLGLAVEDDRFPKGFGLVIKMAHGYDPKAAWHVAHWLLQKWQIPIPPPPAFEGQKVVWDF